MGKTIPICDLRIDQRLNGEAYALKEFEKKVSRQDKPYYNVNLGDKTGEIRGKVWFECIANCDSNLKVGQIVEVIGVVQEYTGKLQIIVESLKACQDMAPDQFLPMTSRNRAEMADDIEDAINEVKDPHLRKLLNLFWTNPDYRDRYINFPAGEYVHHGYIGGMLEHVWEMYKLSLPYFEIYPQLNRDLYFTGLFFHDIGKLEELDIIGATIVRTVQGRLVAHIGQGLLFVHDLIEQIPSFPEHLRYKLYHLILSHQGELEFGSPIRPQTLEALVLSSVDNNSAQMNQATKHIEKNLENGEEFTDYHKWLGRSFYQKDFLQNSSSDSAE